MADSGSSVPALPGGGVIGFRGGSLKRRQLGSQPAVFTAEKEHLSSLGGEIGGEGTQRVPNAFPAPRIGHCRAILAP